jgi:hypothetical protein
LRPPSHGSLADHQQQSSALVKAIRDGLGLSEESFLFALTTNGYRNGDEDAEAHTRDTRKGVERFVFSSALGPLGDTAGCVKAVLRGDITVVQPQRLDDVIWKIGGSAVALRLVELSSVCISPPSLLINLILCMFIQTPHELSRTMSIFADSARMSWQMSEDMEHARECRLHGILSTRI